MNGAWAVRLDQQEIAALGRVRDVPGVRVCENGAAIWLQGSSRDEPLDRILRGLPGDRFDVLPEGKLRPWNRRVPSGSLPDGPWKPLAEWLPLDLPAPGLAGRITGGVPLSVVRSSNAQEPGYLLTQMEAWSAYATRAPQVRLDRWRFAVCRDGRVLVGGRPLPPLPGARLVDHNGVAVPAGWHWSPPVDSSVLRDLLQLASGDVALLNVDGFVEHVTGEQFVRARRSAVRKSAEALRHV